MKLTIREDGSAVLMAKPSPPVLAVARSLEGRRVWLRTGGLRIEASPFNLDRIREALEVEVETLAAEPVVPISTHGTYQPKTQAMPHQEAALAKLRGINHGALFLEQGTGKTKIAIDRAGELWCQGRITGVLVVAPKGVHRQWLASQLPDHSGVPFMGAYWPLAQADQAAIKPGGRLSWFTINIDATRTEKGFTACKEFIEAHGGNVLMIVDESHLIKNAASQRWKAVNGLGQRARFRLILTGTPIAKSLLDEWAQLRWLDERILGIRYATAFKAEYCIMGGFEGRVIVGHKNIERFTSAVAPYSFRVTKEEIGIIPARHSRWEFDLTKEQLRVIREMKTNLISEIDSGEIATAANAAVAMMRMQQVSNGFFTDENGGIVWMMPPDKNPRCIALLELLTSREGSAVIWARFRADIEAIAQALADNGMEAVTYHGGTKDTDRAEAVERFTSGQVPYFISNPMAGGTGLNLQGLAQMSAFYSNSDNAIARWQAEARIHRIGTDGVVTHFDLIAPRSPDTLILRRHATKQAISQMALGDIRTMLEEEL